MPDSALPVQPHTLPWLQGFPLPLLEWQAREENEDSCEMEVEVDLRRVLDLSSAILQCFHLGLYPSQMGSCDILLTY
jgi:hypothetical protein